MSTGAFPLGFDPADLRAAEELGQVRVAEARSLRPEEIEAVFAVAPDFPRNSAGQSPLCETEPFPSQQEGTASRSHLADGPIDRSTCEESPVSGRSDRMTEAGGMNNPASGGS